MFRRWTSLFIALLATVVYISIQCDNNNSYNQICPQLLQWKSTVSPYVEPLSPYVEQGKELIHRVVIDPVSEKFNVHYDTYLLTHVEHVNDVYQTKIKPVIVDKVIDPLTEVFQSRVLPQLIITSDIVKTQLAIGLQKAAVHGKKWSIIIGDAIIKYSKIFLRDLVNIYVPLFCEFCNTVLRYLNLTIKPLLINFYNEFISEYVVKLCQLSKLDIAYEKSSVIISQISQSYYFTAMTSAIHNVYRDLIPKNYDEVESKKEFVKSEFNKIFDAGFKLSKESLQKSNKLIKEKLNLNEKSMETMTSTHTITVTSSLLSEASTTHVESSKSVKFWESLVSKTCELLLNELKGEIAQLEKLIVEEYDPELTSNLQDLRKVIDDGRRDVTKIISTIDESSISRQEFRDVLSQLTQQITDSTDTVKSTLQKESTELSSIISNKRSKTVEMLESFSEFSVQEYSRQLISDTEDDEYWQNWKQLEDIKIVLTSTHEQLLTFEPELTQYDTQLKNVHTTLDVLIHESGDYLAILRAKANLQFQMREQRQREQEQAVLELDHDIEDEIDEDELAE